MYVGQHIVAFGPFTSNQIKSIFITVQVISINISSPSPLSNLLAAVMLEQSSNSSSHAVATLSCVVSALTDSQCWEWSVHLTKCAAHTVHLTKCALD